MREDHKAELINSEIIKKDDYAAHGVSEYWIVDAVKQEVEQCIIGPILRSYEPEITCALNADITSRQVADFTIPVRAIFDEDASLMATNKLIM